MGHMPHAFNSIDMAEHGSQRGNLYSLENRRNSLQKALTVLYHPQRCIERSLSNASATHCCLDYISGVKHHTQPASALVSARYLDHLCIAMTPWVVPAIQGHTKGPYRESFSPANRRLHSTRPNNHSQLGAFIHKQLFTLSPYPEQIHTWRYTLISMLAYKHTHSLKMIRELLLQEDCNQRAISTAPKSFFWIVLKSFFFLFSLCTSIQHFCTSVDWICLSTPLGPL